MSLEERLKEDMKQSMKAREAGKKRLSVIRMVLSAAKYKQIELKRGLTDEDLSEVISKEAKQRLESIGEYRRAGREDIAGELEQEIEVLKEYLPEQLTESELTALAKETIQSVGAAGKKDMGKVMAALMPQLKGKADGSLVSQIVSQLLQ